MSCDTGEATWDEALLLYLERSGFAEETYHTFSYSPLADDAGANTGMLCVVAEVTERVIGERQLSVLRDVGTTLAAASTRAAVMKGLETCLASGARDVPFAVVFLSSREGALQRVAVHDPAHHVASAMPDVDLEDPAAWPLAQAAQGAPVLVDLDHLFADRLRQDRQQGVSPDQLPEAPRQALIVSITGAEGGDAVGYLVAALNPHRAFDSAYQGFIELLTAQVAAAVARADEYERARERADALAEIDRAKTAFFSNVSPRIPDTADADAGAARGCARGSRCGFDRTARAAGHRPPQRVAAAAAGELAARFLADRGRPRAEASYLPTDLAALTADLAASSGRRRTRPGCV